MSERQETVADIAMTCEANERLREHLQIALDADRRERGKRDAECDAGYSPLTLDEAIAHADEMVGDCGTACQREHKQLADWLRELKNRRNGSGDAAELREALESIASNLEHRLFARYPSSASDEWMYQKANAALAAPPRNCDVGTPEEQSKRCFAYCNQYICKDCPCNTIGRCTLVWAQMPYEAEKGANNG